MPNKKSPFTITIKSSSIAAAIPQADRETLFKAVCLFDQKDITGWTDKDSATSAAKKHRIEKKHPVTVLELH